MDPHPSVVDEEVEHHEKPSMFKRAKAKARRFKDSLGMKSHGHDQVHDDHDDEEDDHEEDPLAHNALGHDSTAVKSTLVGRDVITGQDVNLEKSEVDWSPKPHFDESPNDENVYSQNKVTEPDLPVAPMAPEHKNPGYDVGRTTPGNSGTSHEAPQTFGVDHGASLGAAHDENLATSTNLGTSHEPRNDFGVSDDVNSPADGGFEKRHEDSRNFGLTDDVKERAPSKPLENFGVASETPSESRTSHDVNLPNSESLGRDHDMNSSGVGAEDYGNDDKFASPGHFTIDHDAKEGTPSEPLDNFGVAHETPSESGSSRDANSTSLESFGGDHDRTSSGVGVNRGYDDNFASSGNSAVGHDVKEGTPSEPLENFGVAHANETFSDSRKSHDVNFPNSESFGKDHDKNSSCDGADGYGNNENFAAGHDVKEGAPSEPIDNFGVAHASETFSDSRKGHNVNSPNSESFGKDHDKNSSCDGADGYGNNEDFASEPTTSHDVNSPNPESFGSAGDMNSKYAEATGYDDYLASPKHSAGGRDINSVKPNVSFREPLEEGPNVYESRYEDVSPRNDESKLTSPEIGDQEAGVSPISESFDRMNISNEPIQKKESNTGSHDQFSPPATPNLSSYKTNPIPEYKKSAPESFNSTTSENYPQEMNVDEPKAVQPGSSSVTPAVTSEASLGEDDVDSTFEYEGSVGNPGSFGDASFNSEIDGRENATSAKTADASVDKFNDNESTEDAAKPPSTYTGMLSSATYGIASKLGYGGGNNANATPVGSDTAKPMDLESDKLGYGASNDANDTPVGSDTAKPIEVEPKGYDGEDNYQKSSTGLSSHDQENFTETEKLAPVHGTVDGAETAASPNIYEEPIEAKESDHSIKGYMTEKLTPGDDDKALSNAISGAFNGRSNEDDSVVKENKPMGKVTESDEVASRLGSTEAEKTGKISGEDSPGPGMVDKFKGAFSNWFAKGPETSPSAVDSEISQDKNEDHIGDYEKEKTPRIEH